jgi:hypothetical protein
VPSDFLPSIIGAINRGRKMPIENPKYDVALSFLSKDEAIAAAIHRKLSEGLSVFFFPRSQEDLAGTDGLESMRKPFFEDSRVMVVLFRESWGQTPWTRVEETAIKEACLEHGWGRLFFVVLERGALPAWLPSTHVRFNYADYGLEQVVGAIKARVQENGGRHLPPTATGKAELFKADELFRQDKLRMNSDEGRRAIFGSVGELFRQIEKHCADISARGSLKIRSGSQLREGEQFQTCRIVGEHVGLDVVWRQPYSNLLDGSALIIREFCGRLMLPGEAGMYLDKPRLLGETVYSPDLSLAREYGWAQGKGGAFFSSPALAEKCVIRLVELAGAYARGEITDREPDSP